MLRYALLVNSTGATIGHRMYPMALVPVSRNRVPVRAQASGDLGAALPGEPASAFGKSGIDPAFGLYSDSRSGGRT